MQVLAAQRGYVRCYCGWAMTALACLDGVVPFYWKCSNVNAQMSFLVITKTYHGMEFSCRQCNTTRHLFFGTPAYHIAHIYVVAQALLLIASAHASLTALLALIKVLMHMRGIFAATIACKCWLGHSGHASTYRHLQTRQRSRYPPLWAQGWVTTYAWGRNCLMFAMN